MFRVLAILVLGLTAACSGLARVGTETVDARYTTGGGEWDSGGGVTVAARVFEREGTTIVCGAWTTDRQSVLTTELNDDVIAVASVYIGETRVMQNLGFMARVANSASVAGAQANCVASAKPWLREFAKESVRLRFPRMVFQLDEEGGTSVRFRETARPSVVR